MIQQTNRNLICICSKIIDVKNLLKTLVIFLSFIVGLSFNSIDLANSSVDSIAYIQNDSQKVVLLSQNLCGGEVISNRNDNSSDTGFGFGGANFFDNKLNINLTTPYIPTGNIHKISTYKQKSDSIRAP